MDSPFLEGYIQFNQQLGAAEVNLENIILQGLAKDVGEFGDTASSKILVRNNPEEVDLSDVYTPTTPHTLTESPYTENAWVNGNNENAISPSYEQNDGTPLQIIHPDFSPSDVIGAVSFETSDGSQSITSDFFKSWTIAGDNIRGTMGSCLLYTSPSPRDGLLSRMPSSA